MKKLSKKQSEVIQLMRDGIILHYISGFNSKCFFARDMKNINWNTIWKLEQLGLISRTERTIELTELGKTCPL